MSVKGQQTRQRGLRPFPLTGVFAVLLLACQSGWSDSGREAACAAVREASRLLHSSDPFDVASAAGTLLQHGDSESLKPLVSLLNSTNDLVVRAAVDTLISVNTDPSTKALGRLLDAGPEWGEFIAAGAVAIPRGGIDRLLLAVAFDEASQNEQARVHALQALGMRRHSFSESQLAFLIGNAGDRRTVVSLMGSYLAARQGLMLPSAISRLLEASSASAGAREQEIAAIGLAYVRTPESRMAAKKLSDSQDVKVRVAARVALMMLDGAEAQDALVELMVSASPYESSLAAAAVRRLPPDLAFAVTEQVLVGPRPPAAVAGRLIESWAWIDDARRQRVIDWGFGSGDTEVILQTLWLVGWSDLPGYDAEVRRYLSHHDPAVRGMAAWTIVRANKGRSECSEPMAAISTS